MACGFRKINGLAMLVKKIQNAIERRLYYFVRDFLANYGSDSTYLKYEFKHRLGYSLNLDKPRTFNEKLQWLKLNDKNPSYSLLVDKAEVKKYVENIIGADYVIPTIGVWNSIEEIEWEKLPDKFVMKCTHDSGGVVICNDRETFDVTKAKEKLKKGLLSNYYKYNKEYPYKTIVPRIIAEDYIVDESGYELKDYKIFCFDGVPKFLFVVTDRQVVGESVKMDYFDLDWNHIPVQNAHENSRKTIQKPKNFDEMLYIAEKLSRGIKHVRVDLYNCNGKIYFGELTFFDMSGFTKYRPIEWDYKFGTYLKL